MAKIRKFLKDFKVFVERGSAIDMAVGIIVGSTMSGVVNSLVRDVIMPPIGVLIGGVDFSQLFFILKYGAEGRVDYTTIAAAQEAGAATLNLGMFINSCISFLITMFAVFVMVRMVNNIRETASTTRVCPYCKMDKVNVLACRCPFCCSELTPEKPKEAKLKVDNVLKITRKIKKII